jgi:TonB family protein
LIYRKAAEYPKIAKQTGAHGTVTLTATIGTDGTITSVRAISGPPELTQAAMDAVRQWRYKPTMLNGVPVEAQTQVVVNFVPDSHAQTEGDFKPAVLLYRKQPEPQSVAGTVRATATIGKDGRLTDIQIVEGDPALTAAALDAFRQWRYTPATRNGEAVDAQTLVSLTFPAR